LVGTTGQEFTAINLDGTGLSAIYTNHGEWSVQGWLATRHTNNVNSPSDVSIQLLQLPSTSPGKQLPLLSEELAEAVQSQVGWDINTAGDLYHAILSTRSTFMWSPDGRYLVFVAALDGESADLYSYDIVRDRTLRITTGANQPVILGFSPDGKWVVYIEAIDFWIGEDEETNFTSVAVRSAYVTSRWVKKLTDIEFGTQLLDAWRSSTEFLMTAKIGTDFPANLQLVNISNARTTDIFPNHVIEMASDPKSGAILFVSFATETMPEGEGFYILPPRQTTPVQIDTRGWDLPSKLDWSPETGYFYATSRQGSMVIDTSGEVIFLIEGQCLPLPSPDGRWLVTGNWDCDPKTRPNPGMQLYDANGTFVRELTKEYIAKPVWSPDSANVVFNAQLPRDPEIEYFSELRYVTIPGGEIFVLHPTSGVSIFAWIQP
jgi:Tol biopolymer transport system component